MIDLTRGLPTHSTKTWASRTRDPDCVVIHHSVTPGDFPIYKIAEYHIGRGYPGIAYHYVVDNAGETYQCNDDMDLTWHGNDGNTGLGVCLLGDFTLTPPPEAQLAAAVDLVTTLKQRWGITRVIGHRDAGRAATACPGDTWPQWKSRFEEVPVSDYANYPRPFRDTGAGVHGGANASFPLGDNDGLIPGILAELKEMGLSWVKLLDREGVSHTACRLATQAGIMPVVRLYRERPYPGRLDNKHLAALPVLVSAGARYFERGNEPNLVEEWQAWPAWSAGVFDQLVADWLSDCEAIVLAGGYPAIDACSPGGNYDDITFLVEWCKALKRKGLPSWMNRVWISIHNAALNHPLDYPDDAVNQKEHPGQTIHTHYYPGGLPTGASNCIRKWEAVHQLVKDQLGLDLPTLCTEGGVWPGNAADSRYPALSEQEASNRQATVLRQMQTAPPYFFAQMPWLFFNRKGANLATNFEYESWKRWPGFGNCPPDAPAERPVIAALKAVPCQQRSQTVEEAIGAVAQKYVLPLNMEAALAKAAAARGYVPASDEFDTVVSGTTYRAQVFRDPAHLDLQRIAYCIVPNWGHITFFDRKN